MFLCFLQKYLSKSETHTHTPQSLRSENEQLSVCICVIVCSPAPTTLHNQTPSISCSHHFSQSHIGASPSSGRGRHKAQRLGDRYLSCQAADGHGKPHIARIPHQEFVLVKARPLGSQQQNKHKYRAGGFICSTQIESLSHTHTYMHARARTHTHTHTPIILVV